MWKNIFIESCIISALVFGGFYINSVYMKDQITRQETAPKPHISGFSPASRQNASNWQHMSGGKTQKPATK